MIILFQISGIQVVLRNSLVCKLIGIASHYFWLTTYFIMSAISFDFVYHFTNIGSPWYTKQIRFQQFKYCWLASIILTAVPVLLDHFTDLLIDYNGSRRICFISPLKHQIIFFIGPVLLMSSVNTLCFIVTSVYIYKASRSDKALISHISDQIMAKIFTKLAVVMGVTWLFAIVPSLSGVEELWYLFIVVNGLQGMYIFWSFGLPSIKKLREKPSEKSTSFDAKSFDNSVQSA